MQEAGMGDGDDKEGDGLKLDGKERWLSGGKAATVVCDEFSHLPGQVHCQTATASKHQLPAPMNSVRNCKLMLGFWGCTNRNSGVDLAMEIAAESAMN